MRRQNHSFLYFFFVFIGITSSLLGKVSFMYPQIVWYSYTQADSLFVHSLQLIANHRYMGIVLATVGFILLCYLSVYTAIELISHWKELQIPLRLFLLAWTLLLGFSGILNSTLLLQISIYLLLFSVLVLFLSLVCSYFWYLE